MTPTTVITPGAAEAAAAASAAAAAKATSDAAAAAAAKAAPDAAALQRRIDELTTQVGEHQRTAEFWHGKATAQPAAPAKAADAEPEVDILELATQGGKKFEQYLETWAKKNGFVKGTEMNEAIGQKASELAAQGRLIAQYPDLKDDKSEFFKDTALEYGKLKKQGVSELVAMEMAAERTELAFLRGGKLKLPAQKAADDAERKAQERRDRAAAGAGDRGSRPAATDETDTELTPEQKQIAHRLLMDDDTTAEQAEEKYKKRAEKGVAMKLR